MTSEPANRPEPAKQPEPAAPLDWSGIADRLWSLYYRRGYEDGVRQAVRDLLASLLAISEDFLKSQGRIDEQPRKLLYDFEERLEKEIHRLADEAGFVDGGLGI